jgi:2-furoyl-CoA dehydrogenase large subunit
MVGTETGQTPRIDAVPKVTGQAVYTEDLPLPPGTLYGAILRSPYAHARLVTIDAQRAERLPGVHAVVTREHLGDLHPFLHPAADGTEGAGAAPLIALEKVRYEGEGSVANYRKQESLDSQAIDFPIHDFRILPRKGNFATEPSQSPVAIARRCWGV